MGTRVQMTLVTALVLRAVASGVRYGFDIMETTGYPSGTVYPALRRLEKVGYLASSWEETGEAHDQGRPRRRMYRVTKDGKAVLPLAEDKIARAMKVLRGVPGRAGEASR